MLSDISKGRSLFTADAAQKRADLYCPFLAAFELSPVSPSIKWLYVATSNAKNDILHKAYRERELSVVFEPSDPYLHAAIELEMKKLCSSKKEAFLLQVDGFSYEEIVN